MANLVIFGSGKGSNARRLIAYFKERPSVKISALVSNKPRRGFLDISYDHRINLEIIKGPELSDAKWINHLKLTYRPDLIVLVGYMQLIPSEFIQAFSNKIINIHPSLLPQFGGKGMYGNHVHEAVLNGHMQESGISIHLVNEEYDQGKILFQKSCPVKHDDTIETLSSRIHELEYEFLPQVIEQFLNGTIG
jgi:phosphoribosylglycinamide formyltransferase-1